MTSGAPNPIRRRFRILLVASLALNVAVAGLVGGYFLRGGGAGGPPRTIDFAVGPLGQALSREDRREIGQALRDAPAAQALSRDEMRRLRSALADILVAEPFDRSALQAAMADMRGQFSAVQDAATELLLDRVEQMTPAQRQGYADALNRRRSEGHD